MRIRKLLIRSTNWIGDAVMTTPAVRSIRQNFPEAEITILALPWVADIFQASPQVDNIFLYERNGRHAGFKGKVRLANDLRQEKFEAAILLQNAFEAAFITFLARIPVRAGYTTDGRGILLSHGVKKQQAVKERHQVHYYQEMLRGLGFAPGADELEVIVPDKAARWADAYIQDHARQGLAKIVGLNPGAAYGPAKRWPADKFADLAGLIAADPDTVILIFGTDADREAARIISEKIGNKSQVVDLAGQTTLAQAMGLINKCNVFVTNDSGLMHVSAAMDTNTVAVFGSTNPITTGPYSDTSSIVRSDLECSPCLKTHCPKKHFQCMEDIETGDVFKVVQNFLVSS